MLRLPKPAIKFDVAPTRQGFRVTVTSDGLARAAYLSAGGLEGAFTDNYLDLMPGKPFTVEYRTRERLPVSQFSEKLKIISLVDAF